MRNTTEGCADAALKAEEPEYSSKKTTKKKNEENKEDSKWKKYIDKVSKGDVASWTKAKRWWSF